VKQYVRLVFMGIDPDEVTRLLGIAPTKTRKTRRQEASGGPWSHDLWELTSPVDEDEIVAEKHFEALFERLEPCARAIRDLALRCEPVVSWIVQAGPDESAPVGVISSATLGKIHDIGACLNVDMYFDAQGPSASRGLVT
jgi:hypothetical protein